MPLPGDVTGGPIAGGPGGDLWMGAEVGRFTRVAPDGTLSTLDVPGLAASPVPIASQSRRYLWFAEATAEGGSVFNLQPVVGRIDAAGRLRQYRLPPGPQTARPSDMEVGPDGAIWVARGTRGKPGEIDRIAPDGKVRRFQVGRDPGPVLADRHDGAWFAEAGPRIAHVTASGEIHTFPLAGEGVIGGLTFGRNGSLWFTRAFRPHLPSSLGRLTRGEVTERDLHEEGEPGEIVSDRKGGIWFAQQSPRRVGHLTPSGKLKIIGRGAAAASSVTIGPEGNVWFASADQGVISVFNP